MVFTEVSPDLQVVLVVVLLAAAVAVVMSRCLAVWPSGCSPACFFSGCVSGLIWMCVCVCV